MVSTDFGTLEIILQTQIVIRKFVEETRESLQMCPGDDRKEDSEYIRNGTCSIFAFVEPLVGRHHVSVRGYRTVADCAEEIKYLVDVMYPDVEKSFL